MEERVMPTGLSPSSIGLWQQCPARFEQEKVLGRRSPGTVATTLGTFAHRVLEVVMGMDPSERTLKSAREVLGAEWPALLESEDWQTLALSPDDMIQFRRQAWHAVAGYWETEHPAEVEVLARERYLSVEVEGVPLRGIIDRLDRDVFGDTVVTDYKTGKVPAPAFRADKFFQLNIYGAMVEAVDGVRPAEGRLIFTTAAKVLSTSIDGESVGQAVEVAQDVWEALEVAERHKQYEPRVGPLCGWCPFVSQCEPGLAEVTERFVAGRLKKTAPAYAVVAGSENG